MKIQISLTAGLVLSAFALLGCVSLTPTSGPIEPTPSFAVAALNTLVATETDAGTEEAPEHTPQRLTQEMANEAGAPIQGVWSPDSSRVAYHSSHRGGVRKQAIIDLEGNIEIELTHGIGPFFFVLPSWSANGDRVAYTVNGECCEFEGGAAVEIEVASTNRENRQQLTKTAGEDLVVPRYFNWIENDSKLLYTSSYREETSFRTGIFTVESTGGEPKLILREADQPHVCKIDSRVVYAHRWGGIRIADTDGNNEEILFQDPTLTPGLSPKWSPTCEHLVYRSISPDATELRVLRLDGAEPTLVQSHLGSLIRHFDWSPDGQYIVFDQDVGPFNWDIMVLSIQTGETQRLTTDEAEDRLPSWSPDGSKILFTSNRQGGTYDLYLIEVTSVLGDASLATVDSPLPASLTVVPATLPTLQPTATLSASQAKATQIGPIATLDPATENIGITKIHMTSENMGWALASSGEQIHVLRTSDGGRSWRVVTPPKEVWAEQLTPREYAAPRLGQGLFLDDQRAFLSTKYARIGSFYTSAGELILSSEDGGETWQIRSLPEAEGTGYDNFVGFLGSGHGWFTMDVYVGMGLNYTTIYKTSDGGESWELVHDVHGTVSSFSPTLAFGDATNGVMTFRRSYYIGEPFVRWTQDGGATWGAHQFLPEPLSLSDFGCGTNFPHAFSPVDVTLLVDCSPDQGPADDLENFVYKTEDGGATWDSFPAPEGRLFMLDPRVGWMLGQEIHRTLDGGHTWTKMNTVTWEGQFSFVDADRGWAVAKNEDETVLVKTENGGRTWTTIEPQLVP